MDFSNMFKGFTDFFSIDKPVTSSSFDMSDDVIKTQNALSDLGHFNTQTPDIGEGLKSFQADNGLKVDGIMNPGGPTENALSQTLADQGIGNMDILAKTNTPLPSNVEVNKPVSSNPGNKSWIASASFGETPKPKAPSRPKIDPITGLEDPLAKTPKPKANMKKAWDDFYKQQAEKAKTAIVPQGDTVNERIRSMMQDNRYQDKRDTGLRDHVVKQFERAYPGNVQYDETGKMIQPKPVIAPDEVEPYDPNGELYYDQGQTDYVQGQPNELSQRDQTATADNSQTEQLDYPQGASSQSASQQSNDQLGPELSLDDAAVKEASAYGLDSASHGEAYQVASAEQTGVTGDTEKTTQTSSYKVQGVSKAFRDKLFERESRGNGGYKAKNIDADGRFALGRYQMRKPALQDAGFIDAQGNWTGKHGVNSMEDFLNKPEAQENAFGAFMKKMEGFVKHKGAFKSIGVEVDGLLDKFKITKSGLMSAAHRQGQEWVAKYLKHQKENGWKSDFSKLDQKTQTFFKRVEKSLRTFEGVPYED